MEFAKGKLRTQQKITLYNYITNKILQSEKETYEFKIILILFGYLNSHLTVVWKHVYLTLMRTFRFEQLYDLDYNLRIFTILFSAEIDKNKNIQPRSENNIHTYIHTTLFVLAGYKKRQHMLMWTCLKLI